MNLPWMKFEASSWLIDTRVLSAEAKGVWIDILASMWQQLGKPNAGEPGSMTKTVGEFARLTGVSPETMLRVVHEFEENYICDVTWHVTPDVTPNVTSSVTILSRRMSRDVAEREGAAERKRRSRTSKNGDDVSTRKTNDLRNVTAMSQQCHTTEERRGDKNREEKKE